MKEEEFNDFLRNRADSFELKPSSGSFDAVTRKMKRKNKRRGVLLILPLLAAALVFTIQYYTSDEKAVPKNEIAQLQNGETTMPNKVEQTPQTSATANADEIENKKPNTNSSSGLNNTDAVEIYTPKNLSNTPKSSTSTAQVITTLNTSNNNNAVTESVTNTNNQKETLKTEVDQPKQPQIVGANKETDNNNKQKAIEIVNTSELNKVESLSDKKPEKVISTTGNKEKNDSNNTCKCNEKKWAIKTYINPYAVNYLPKAVYGSSADESLQDFSSLTANQTEDFTKERLNNGLSLGVSAERKIAKRWGIGFGLAYSKWDLDISNWTTKYERDSFPNYTFDTNTNQSVVENYTRFQKGTLVDSSVTNVAFQSLQLPVYINFNLINSKRFSFDMQMGVTASTIFKTTYTETRGPKLPTRIGPNNQRVNKLYDYKNFNVNFNTGFMANYTIGKCWGIYGGPNIGVPLLTIQSKGSDVNRRPVFLGVEAGVRFRF